MTKNQNVGDDVKKIESFESFESFKIKSISELSDLAAGDLATGCLVDDRRSWRGVLFDIDDTFTTAGKIEATAFSSLWKLYQSGIKVVAVTGRPAGMCDHIARMWPINAVVGENGAFYFMMQEVMQEGKIRKFLFKRYLCSPPSKERVMEVWKCIESQIPRARIASDQNYREFDLAIDFGEDVSPALSPLEIARIVEIFQSHGARAKVSSIHVNGWWGDYDKLSAVKILFKEQWQVDLDNADENLRYIFCGDSPNDEPMFRFFKNSVGVQNVKRFLQSMQFPPRYITDASCGEGFAEVVNLVLRDNA
ncbi:MAG: HAD family phosphatase [Oligoflexia bacterium]|nr:HAD family phosphatase [Oligoflexia bacterium]